MPVISGPRGAASSGSGGRGTSASTTTTATTVIVNDLNDDISVTSASFTLLRDNEPLPPEHQELNVKALQRKLMELKAQEEGVPLFTKTKKYNNNNNNNNNRVTRSQNNIDDVKKKGNGAGEKPLSKSVNNLTSGLAANNTAHKGYHRNCYTSAPPADYAYYQLYGSMAAAAVAKHNNYRNNLQNGGGQSDASPNLARKKRSPEGGTPPAAQRGRQAARERPMFVTTVKTGRFLEPPPELAALLGLAKDEAAPGMPRGHQRQVLLYSFSSQPRVLPSNGARQQVHKSRCPAAAAAAQRLQQQQQKKQDVGPPAYGNIMYDRRVVRGSTFAQHPVPTDGESQAARQAEVRRRALARKRAHAQQGRLRVGSPPPVPGRRHETVQTSAYLEEILDRPVEADACCQTDLFLDRPPTPPYVPAKTGIDQETQIYPGDLFDFDVEVEPILEVLVGKTIEQAMIEVLSEEELAAMRAQQRRLEERRAGEEAEIKRLEERERRMREEKDRRLSQLELELKEQQEAEERLAAALLTRGYLEDALPAVLRGLNEAGYFIDDIREDVLQNFMPWLMNEVRQEMDQMVASRQVLSDLVRDIVRTRREFYLELVQRDRRQHWLDGEERDEEAEKRLKKEKEKAEAEAASKAAEEMEGEEDDDADDSSPKSS